MSNSVKDLIKDVTASPLGDVIAAVGEGVAEAQQALDEGSLAKTLEIYTEGGDDLLKVLKDIGYRPTFYTLPETTGEVKVALQLGNVGQPTPAATTAKKLRPELSAKLSRVGMNVAPKPRIYASMVDGGYANRYSYQADISAKLTFKIVPVPPPEGADELRRMVNLSGSKEAATTVADARNLTAEEFVLIVKNAEGTVLDAPDETAEIARQSPLAGEIVRLGDEVVVTLKA